MGSQITSDTPTNLVCGAGNFYRNQDPLGATTGDNTFRIERDLISPEINGAKGKLIGTDYVKRSEGFLETALLEASSITLSAGWAGSRSSTNGDTITIDETDTRRIPVTDYADYELQVERLGGGEFQFEVDDALQTGNVEATLTDSGFFAPKYTFASRWDPAALTASPHRIRVMATAS